MDELVISITTYNRSEIAIKSISQLIALVPTSIPIYLSDDGSNEKVLLDFLATIKQNRNVILLNENKPHNGAEENNINRCATIAVNHPNAMVYLTDDDVLYSSQFFNELNQLVTIMANDKTILAATLFNTFLHPVKSVYGNDYVEKKSMGGCSILINVNDFVAAMNYYQNNKTPTLWTWDWGLCAFAKHENKKLIATRNSFVQHIGKVGLNSQPYRFDYAKNFIY